MHKWLEEKRNQAARAAQLRLCKKCNAPIITGLDEDVAALKVEIDPTPLGPLGEARALLADRATYELLKVSGAQRIYRRSVDDIRYQRPGPVYPTHRCGQPIDDPEAAQPPQRPDDEFPTPEGFPF